MRCSITHAGNMRDEGEIAPYSTGSKDRYFDVLHAPDRTAKEAATSFAERLPQIVQMGRGRDCAHPGTHPSLRPCGVDPRARTTLTKPAGLPSSRSLF